MIPLGDMSNLLASLECFVQGLEPDAAAPQFADDGDHARMQDRANRWSGGPALYRPCSIMMTKRSAMARVWV
jgi:hypothetical protein